MYIVGKIVDGCVDFYKSDMDKKTIKTIENITSGSFEDLYSESVNSTTYEQIESYL